MAREVPLHVKSNVWKTLARRTVLSRLPWYEIEEERVELPDGRVIVVERYWRFFALWYAGAAVASACLVRI